MTRIIKPVEYTEGFLSFWSECLIKKGKQAAQRAWNNHGLEARAEEVTMKMAMCVKMDFKKRQDGYTPHPATWINAGCYDDDEMIDKKAAKENKWRERFERTGKTIEYWN